MGLTVLEEGLGQDAPNLDVLSGYSWEVSAEIESKFVHNLGQISLVFHFKAGQFEFDLFFSHIEKQSTDNLRPEHVPLPTAAKIKQNKKIYNSKQKREPALNISEIIDKQMFEMLINK